MDMLLMFAQGCRSSFSGAITSFTPTYFFSTSTAGWTIKSAFTSAALAFKKFNNVENINFFDHACGPAAAAANYPFCFAVGAILFGLLITLADRAILVKVSTPIALFAG
jgi:hypothetical protein